MDTTTQVITVVATLSGAVLTFLANSYLERRRGRDARELEAMRRAAEHAHWLRDERLNAYAQLSIAGEEALQFIRSELPLLATPSAREQRAAAESRWRELRTAFRKAYNRVALFATDEVRTAAHQMWLAGWHGGNDYLRDLADAEQVTESVDWAARAHDVAMQMGKAGDAFLERCRQEIATP
ncbi:hypothetical protein ACWD3I_43775 [Streptomyces sp. NPDC002817]|uniref:hypothetical protein n=2 Tax=unclassified Streptomyces TaxID=2593676 RepID=UPI00343A36EB